MFGARATALPTVVDPESDVEVALLDLDGVIVEVNDAWVTFCSDNGGDLARAGVGMSYLEACAAAGDDPFAQLVAAAIRAAVLGDLPAPVTVLLPCASPERDRWFDVLVSSRYDDAGDVVGAVVTLSQAPVPCRPHAVSPPVGYGLLDASPDGLLLTDAEGRLAYVNHRLEVMTGYHRSQLLGRPVEMLVPLAARARHRSLREAFQGDPSEKVMGEGLAVTLRRRDGSTLPVEINLAPTRVGSQTMTAAGVRDVTAQRAAERDLRRLLSLLDVVPDAVFVIEADGGRLQYANRGACELLGYFPAELVGIPASAVRPTLTRELRVAQIEELARDSRGARLVPDAVLRTRAGELIPCEIHQRLTADDDGTRYLVCAVRDIRPRLADQERLRENEQLFRTAFEQAPIGMAMGHVEASGHAVLRRVNQALADLLGERVDGLVGAELSAFVPPEDVETDRAANRALALGDARSHARDQEYLRRDGSSAWAELRVSAVDLAGDSGVTTLAHVVDVTRRHAAELERSLSAATTRLSADITTSVLAGRAIPRVCQDLVEGVARLLDAREAGLYLRDPGTGRFAIAAGTGPAATALLTGAAQIGDARLAELFARGPLAYPDLAAVVPAVAGLDVGPVAVAPFTAPPAEQGLLGVGRAPGAAPFTAAEAEALSTLAARVAVAMGLGRARADQERLAVFEDRARIARDLHDTVIQDLIAIGIQVDRRIARDLDDERRERDTQLVAQLEESVRRLRRAVFELRGSPYGTVLTQSTTSVVTDAARVLGFQPNLTLRGPIDAVPAPVGDHVTFVLREALSNVARHAQASRADVVLKVTGADGAAVLSLRVDDDGVGPPPRGAATAGTGTIQQRAHAVGGTWSRARRPGGGTRLTWTCPVPLASPPLAAIKESAAVV